MGFILKNPILITVFLLFIVILAMLLNPPDNRLLKRINQDGQQIQDLGMTNQPALGRDYSLNPSDYTYSADNLIQTTEQELLRWRIGDKISYIQDSEQKYASIVGIDYTNFRLQVWGGDTANNGWVFTNDPLTELRISTAPQGPEGFPLNFIYTPTLSDNNSGTVTFPNPGTSETEWLVDIVGNKLSIKVNTLFTTTAASAEDIYFTLPFGVDNDPNTRTINSAVFIDNGSTIHYLGRTSADPNLSGDGTRGTIQFSTFPGNTIFKQNTTQRLFLDITYSFEIEY